MHHCFYDELRVAPPGTPLEEHPALVVHPLPMQQSARELLARILFETFHVPAVMFAPRSTLAIMSPSRTSGLSVDIGRLDASVVPCAEGRNHFPVPVEEKARSTSVAGDALDTYMTRLLAERGYAFTTTAEREIVRDIKEKLCYVALDFDAEMQTAAASSALEKSYELPDGQVVILGNERFRCAEALFQPSLIGSSEPGLHEVIYKTIMACDVDLRKDLWSNIVLSGGSTLFAGLADRLQKELTAIAPASMHVKVISPPERKWSAWIGGSIWASLTSTEALWITRQAYDEAGPRSACLRRFDLERGAQRPRTSHLHTLTRIAARHSRQFA